MDFINEFFKICYHNNSMNVLFSTLLKDKQKQKLRTKTKHWLPDWYPR